MGMRERIKKTAASVDKDLAATELTLLTNTSLDLDKLSPDITSHSLYKPLISVIHEASSLNWNTAKLQERIESLGSEAWELTTKIIEAVK